MYQYMPVNEELWVEKIKKFQEEQAIEDSGYFKQGDATYNILQCKVAEELALTDEYHSCIN